MKIVSLTAFEVPVRLRRPVRHASNVRTHNDALIVRCELNDGSVGWGEGLPRIYVTGESISSVWRHLTATDFHHLADADLSGPADTIRVLDDVILADVLPDDGISVRECFGNSVRCAVELAILDAICRSAGCTVGEAIAAMPEAAEISEPSERVVYSGVVTSGGTIKQWRSAIRMKLFGFRQIKVKVGTAGLDDETLLRRVRRITGRHTDLRLDANEAWTPEAVLPSMQPLIPYGPSCLEQPVAHHDVQALPDIRKELSVPIMLDESLCCREDAQRAVDGGLCDLLNLRISKCGGLVNCVRLAAFARQHGLGYQLGCLVGESGILSAAGRQFACHISGIRYLEGSYDRFLVHDRLITGDITFGYGGRASQLCKPGLGVTVDEAVVRRKSVRTQTLFSA